MRQGFTLVELAIVLAILGLLIGGIIAGQSVIETSKLNSVITDLRQYEGAVQNFHGRFRAWPGDMPNATQMWGSLGGDGSNATCQNTAATAASTATCNGDGNIVLTNGAVATAEIARFWQHLANAGLIAGKYNGVFGTTIGQHVPGSRLASNVYFRTNYNTVADAGSTSTFAGDFRNNQLQVLTTNLGSAGTFPFTPEEALRVDTKLDNGLPATGNYIGSKGTAAIPCTTTAGAAVSAADNSATFNVTNKSKDCAIQRVRLF